MRKAWERYLEEQKELQNPGTWQRRAYWSQLFLAFFEQRALDLKSLTRKQLDECQQWLLWKPRPNGKLFAPHTVHQGMRMLRQFLRWAATQGLCRPKLVDGWSFGRCLAREPLLLNRAQLESIIQAPGSHPIGLRDRSLLCVFTELGFTGNRCQQLDVSDFDPAKSELDGVSVSPILAEKLHRYLRQARPALLSDPAETALFLSREGRRPSRETLWKVISRATHGQPIEIRTLHRSWLAQRQALLKRRLPGI